jgi:hypothetical protein
VVAGAVELDDEAGRRPAEVGLLAGDVLVDVRQRESCVGDQRDGPCLGVGAAALELKARQLLDLDAQRGHPAAPAVRADGGLHKRRGRRAKAEPLTEQP